MDKRSAPEIKFGAVMVLSLAHSMNTSDPSPKNARPAKYPMCMREFTYLQRKITINLIPA